DHPVAVVVPAVAQLGGAWPDGRLAVVAIRVVSHVAFGGLARCLRARRCTKPIPVHVPVPVLDRGESFVDGAVAVVVFAVVDLGRTRTGTGAGVGALGVALDVASRCAALRHPRRVRTDAGPVDVLVPDDGLGRGGGRGGGATGGQREHACTGCHHG